MYNSSLLCENSNTSNLVQYGEVFSSLISFYSLKSQIFTYLSIVEWNVAKYCKFDDIVTLFTSPS